MQIMGLTCFRTFQKRLEIWGGSQIRYGSSKVAKVDLSGIFPPIPTPFTRDTTSICLPSLEKNLKMWNTVPFKGYVVMGTNGESALLSNKEKIELTRRVRALSKPGHVIIAGTGCQSTMETIDLTRAIGEEKSADAALIMTPFFFRNHMTDTALIKHYATVADASPVPIILYSVPGNTNLDLSTDVIINLAKHENIIGLKDSSGDVGKLAHVVHATRAEDFQVLVGTAGVLLPALLVGNESRRQVRENIMIQRPMLPFQCIMKTIRCHLNLPALTRVDIRCVGGIVALGNVLGREVCQVQELFSQGKINDALTIQQRLVIPNQVMVRKYSVSGLKATLDMIGLYGGPPRPPLLPADPKQIEDLKRTFKAEKFFDL